MGRFQEYLKEVGSVIGVPSPGHCNESGTLDPLFREAQFKANITNLYVAAKGLSGDPDDINKAIEMLQQLHPDKIDEINKLK